MGILLKTTTTHDIQMKTISLALVLATTCGMKLNETTTDTSTSQILIDRNFNSPLDIPDEWISTNGQI